MTNQTALRDRIADVLAEADGWVWVPDFDKALSPIYRSFQRRADKVLAVLPATTDQTADRAAVLREAASAACSGAVQFSTEAAQAAMKNGGPFALIAYAQLAISDHLRRMADETPAAETNSATLLDLVRDFLDPDPCSFDHHGYCQAHGYLGGEPMSCPHGRAKKLLAELEQNAAGARQDRAQK